MHAARDNSQPPAARTGVLLVNLGTPDSYARRDVRRYLKEFLSDRRVVELPRMLWLPVLYGVILTTRPQKSARAYKKVWREDGAPLLVYSQHIQRKLRRVLRARNPEVTVELGMRYGSPSIAHALAKLHTAGARKIIVLPLYPQYCAATTASTYDAVGRALRQFRRVPALRMIDDYHAHPQYIGALAHSVRARRDLRAGEILLLSFHGIPESFARAGDPYPRQCKTTAQLLADELQLNKNQWRMSFQSRLGRAQWLRPYTEPTLESLARDGVRSVRVLCPGFSADCLETLEEIAIEARETFLRAGGESFEYIACLNDDDAHIDALRAVLDMHARDWLAQ